MQKENTYITPYIHRAMPDATEAEKLEVMSDIVAFHEMLWRMAERGERFDFAPLNMVDSESITN